MIFAIAISLVFLQTQASELANPITLEDPCIGTKPLMQELSHRSGLKLSAIGDILNDNLAIRWTDVPLKEVMKRLESAESGEWKFVDGGYRFSRSSKKLENEARLKLQDRIGLFESELQEMSKSIARSPQFTEALATQILQKARSLAPQLVGKDWSSIISAQQGIYDLLPMRRCLYKILPKIPIDQLAQILPGFQVVFSSAPNETQLPLPEEISPDLEALSDEQRIWSDIAQPDAQNGYFYGALKSGESAKISRVLLVCSRKLGSSILEIRMSVVDDKGRIINQAIASLGSPKSSREAQTKEPTVIDETPEEQEVIRLIKATGAGPQAHRTPISSSLRSKLLRPDLCPIGSLYAGPILLRMAGKLNEDLTAVLSESLISEMATKPRGRSLSSKVFDDFRGPNSATTFEEKNANLEFRPRYFQDAINERINTAALTELTQEANSSGNVSINNLASFAINSNEASLNNPITESYLEAQLDSGFRPLSENDFLALQFFGAMDQSQRERAKSSISVSELSEPQRQIIRRMIYGSGGYLSVYQSDITSEYLTVSSYATEVLSSGFSESSKVQLSSLSDNWIFAGQAVEGRCIGEQRFDEGTLAFVMSRNPRQAEASLTLTSFQPIRLHSKILNLTFSKSAAIRLELVDRQPRSPMVFDIKDLPQEFRRIYDAVLPDYRRRANNSNSF